MSWIQENKFVAGLAGVTGIIGGAILFFGNSQGGAYQEKMQQYEELKSRHAKLEKSKPYPNTANLEARKEGIAGYDEVIKGVRATLSGYQAGSLAKLTPQQFSDIQVKMENEMREVFKGISLPEECNFGFEKYADVEPRAEATAQLNYQLEAMKWLLNQLALAKPDALVNIRRSELAIEKGPVVQPRETTRGGRGGRSARGNRSRQAKVASVEKLYELMPVELSFTGDEGAVRTFLKAMANSKEYYYAIRALRVRNQKQTPPTVNDANFPAGGGGAGAPAGGGIIDPFGGLGVDEVEIEGGGGGGGGAIPVPAPAPKPVVAAGERILKQVLGSEQLHVYIRFDILLLKGGEKKEAASPADPKNA